MTEQTEHETKKITWQKIKAAWAAQWQRLKIFLKTLQPEEAAWRRAAWAMIFLGFLAALVMAVDVFLPVGWGVFVIALIFFAIAYSLAMFLLVKLVQGLAGLPWIFLWGAGTALLLTMTGFGFFDKAGFLMAGFVLLSGTILGMATPNLFRRRWRMLILAKKILTVSGFVFGLILLAGGLVWLLGQGTQAPLPDLAFDSPSVPSLAADLADPSSPGVYDVQTLTYGSGQDQRRPEFAESVDLVSRSVDGSKLVSGWTDLRTRVWGFDETTLPLNGRVWYPDGDGPFPLVLVVHGNHLAEDYSDPGYAYLCELLASQGMVCVSVDENFLNGSGVGDFLGFKGLQGENDLRGWLLLEHLALWADWQADTDHPFFRLVNLDRIALIGHSRGGEAVAIAAAFNRLPYYPDNANVAFDYDFGIQSVVAIAPVDRQYQPAGEAIPLVDLNYLTLQGSHDMDVRSFDGYNAFDRVQFTGADFYFKSAFVIWGANHGQFNTVWGDNDLGTPPIWLMNREQLISGVDQQQAAKVLIGAFLQATLQNQMAYLPLFQNVQTGLAWLPDSLYYNAYGDSQMQVLANFEEDLDLTTGTAPGVIISASGLEGWHENRVPTRWGRMHTNSAVVLQWDQADGDQTFTLQLPNDLPEINSESQFYFSAAQTRRTFGDSVSPIPADFLIELRDSSGQSARLSLSKISPLQPAFEVAIFKLGFLDDDPTSEVAFQTYLFDLADFEAQNRAFSLADLYQIRFIFYRSEAGEILLDDIGFRMAGDGLIE